MVTSYSHLTSGDPCGGVLFIVGLLVPRALPRPSQASAHGRCTWSPRLGTARRLKNKDLRRALYVIKFQIAPRHKRGQKAVVSSKSRDDGEGGGEAGGLVLPPSVFLRLSTSLVLRILVFLFFDCQLVRLKGAETTRHEIDFNFLPAAPVVAFFNLTFHFGDDILGRVGVLVNGKGGKEECFSLQEHYDSWLRRVIHSYICGCAVLDFLNPLIHYRRHLCYVLDIVLAAS